MGTRTRLLPSRLEAELVVRSSDCRPRSSTESYAPRKHLIALAGCDRRSGFSPCPEDEFSLAQRRRRVTTPHLSCRARTAPCAGGPPPVTEPPPMTNSETAGPAAPKQLLYFGRTGRPGQALSPLPQRSPKTRRSPRAIPVRSSARAEVVKW